MSSKTQWGRRSGRWLVGVAGVAGLALASMACSDDRPDSAVGAGDGPSAGDESEVLDEPGQDADGKADRAGSDRSRRFRPVGWLTYDQTIKIDVDVDVDPETGHGYVEW